MNRRGGRFIANSPNRSRCASTADEWVPIDQGTHGALVLALVHEAIALGLYDRDFLA